MLRPCHTGSVQCGILYKVSQITRVQKVFQSTGQPTARRSISALKKPSPFPAPSPPNFSSEFHTVSSNGPNQKRFEAKDVRKHPNFEDRKLTDDSRNHPSVDAQDQRQAKHTSQSSTSSTASERETPSQQRGLETPTFFAGTTAYTQYGVTETFRPEPQRQSANKLSPYRSTIEHRDLAGGDSQAFGTSSIQNEPRTARLEEAFACPYHRSILQERPTNPRSGQALSPMDRYLAEGPSERYAILHRPEAGKVSTYNGCRCLEIMQSSNDTNGHAQQ